MVPNKGKGLRWKILPSKIKKINKNFTAAFQAISHATAEKLQSTCFSKLFVEMGLKEGKKASD